MKSNNSQNVLENTPLLNQFVQKVWFEPQTPSIIRLVSSKADYMKLCAGIVNDDESNAFLRSFTLVCRQKGIDIRLLREKLIPVANALGLTIESVASQDYYHVLGLTPAASTDEIKKAFRQKARKVHPDTNYSGKSQSSAFVKLNEAYQTLSNPESRRCYDQNCQPIGLWNEQRSQDQSPPRKFGFIYMIGGLALFFITVAFIFDFIFREEILSDIPYTDQQPPISTLEHATLSNNKAKDNLLFKSETKPQTSDDKKITKKTSARVGAMEFIDTQKNSALIPVKGVSPSWLVGKKSTDKHSEPERQIGPRVNSSMKTGDVTIVSAPSPPVLPKSDKNDHQTLLRSAKYSQSSTPSPPRPQKDSVLVNQEDKIENFLKTYCMTYEQKKLKKFVSFFKPDAIENGKPFHTLLPQYRHNFATIASITYTIVMHKYSYLSDSTDIWMEGEFFVRWREYGANWKKNSGSVSMRLEQSEKSFLVKQLYYLGRGHNDTETRSADQVMQDDLPVLEEKVEKFLNTYCQTYENKNLTEFASFFRPDATENGKPFHTLLPQYRQNFSMIDSMKYTIIVHRYSRLDAKTVKIDGAFSVRWRKYNGNQSKNSGSISMVLSVEDNLFRVKELNYRSD